MALISRADYPCPNVRCPDCGAPPRLGVGSVGQQAVVDHGPDAVVLTYQCHRKNCGRIYPITAQAMRGAA